MNVGLNDTTRKDVFFPKRHESIVLLVTVFVGGASDTFDRTRVIKCGCGLVDKYGGMVHQGDVETVTQASITECGHILGEIVSLAGYDIYAGQFIQTPTGHHNDLKRLGVPGGVDDDGDRLA